MVRKFNIHRNIPINVRKRPPGIFLTIHLVSPKPLIIKREVAQWNYMR